MQAEFELRYLKRQEIDTVAWNACITTSVNGLIYARSFFLDQMADNWDGLVLGNYKAVMPLPWRKKWGIAYIYQVPFIQRLGVYGNQLTEDVVAAFYKVALRHFKFINYKTESLPFQDTKVLSTCSNFIVDVFKSWEQIQTAFGQECVKNIRKAEKRGCFLKDYISAKDVVELFITTYGDYYPHYDNQIYQNLEKLIVSCCREGFCKTYAVVDSADEIVFAAAIFQDEKRFYYCVGAPTEKGRKMRAPYFFISKILETYAGQQRFFDFEGSDIPNVASFYSKFGPVTETYFDILINKLPVPLRWLKQK